MKMGNNMNEYHMRGSDFKFGMTGFQHFSIHPVDILLVFKFTS